VQPDRLGDPSTEPLGEPIRTGVAVLVVGAFHELLAADRPREMPDVVH
jgi:hypothetical protein